MNLNTKKGLSIFSRLLIALLGVVVLVSGLLTSVFYVYELREEEKQATESILQQFETISYHFRTELRASLVKDLQLLSTNPILDDFLMSSESEREINGRAVERFFLESLKYSRSYERISFVNYAGQEIVKVDWSGRVRTYRNISRGSLFKRLVNAQLGSIDVESPVRDRNGNFVFVAGISKTDADIGKFGGVVVIEHNLNEFIGYLDRIKIFDVHPVWLFTSDGAVLMKPVLPLETLDPRPFLRQEIQKEPVLERVDGGLLVYQDLYVNPDHPLLRLAISIPSRLLLQDIKKVLQFFLIVSVITLLVISLLAYYLAGYLSRPIVELAHAASQLAKGDRSARVQGTSTGEVRMLVESFNQMAEDIERTTVSKDYMDNIISSMMDTLIVVSLDYRIVRLNEAACFLLGYEEADLRGQPIERVIVDELGTERSALSEVLERGSISAIEIHYVTKSGTRVPVLFSASVMRDAGNAVQGIVCVAQDITERKRAEAQLKAYSEELLQINEELKSFTYIVSHDLRAPLVNIKGFSEELILGIREIGPLLEKYLDGFNAEERKKFSEVLKKDIPEALKFIGSSVNRMDNLINAILKLSRAGRRKLNPEPVNTNELIQSILNSLAHQIETRMIRVTMRELPEVVADKMVVEQIFGNLIDNAVKYLDPDRAGEIEISTEQRESELIFHVRDNGRGMAHEDIPKAFEIFRRVGRQDVPGEGMGLAHVKTLVRLHGGRIWCESEPGVGTTFSFTLPQLATETEALPEAGTV